MPKVIVKCRYYNTEKTRKSIGGMLEYIGTREGVEKLDDAWKTSRVPKRQSEFIDELVKRFHSICQTSEYSSYLNDPTKGSASELIASVVENHPELLYEKSYLD